MKIVRHIQLKVWPEITSVFPAILPFERVDPRKENPLDIDFSNVKTIDSSSLVLLLVTLIKVIREAPSRKWIVKDPVTRTMSDRLVLLGAYQILQATSRTLTLDWTGNITTPSSDPLNIITSNETTLSYPIFHFKFEGNKNKRELVDEFREHLFTSLRHLQTDYKFKIHKLIQVLTEMAKNSADHTNSDAFFGLDIIIKNKHFSLKFAFGDLGDGINRHVRNIISIPSRKGHLGLTDAYHFALTPGKSTAVNSKINRGIGMTIILDMAKEMGLNLSVFDAESRGVLSNINAISHSDLRKNFYHMGKSSDIGFYYYGDYEHLN